MGRPLSSLSGPGNPETSMIVKNKNEVELKKTSQVEKPIRDLGNGNVEF